VENLRLTAVLQLRTCHDPGMSGKREIDDELYLYTSLSSRAMQQVVLHVSGGAGEPTLSRAHCCLDGTRHWHDTWMMTLMLMLLMINFQKTDDIKERDS